MLRDTDLDDLDSRLVVSLLGALSHKLADFLPVSLDVLCKWGVSVSGRDRSCVRAKQDSPRTCLAASMFAGESVLGVSADSRLMTEMSCKDGEVDLCQ